jgi:hypothetical protein
MIITRESDEALVEDSQNFLVTITWSKQLIQLEIRWRLSCYLMLSLIVLVSLRYMRHGQASVIVVEAL